MHIQELEIDNFKSCAGKVTIPFLQGFTTIAGLNGSGKSNIIDSILFCLGLSASRSAVRVESLSDFISFHNKRDEASVKITFADDNNNIIMVVERKVKRASSGYVSVYHLDGKTSSLTEIHEKLLKYNVTPNSYNVVMQHEVAKITQSTPLNRRRIIDEIAGVADFDRKIEQAIKELDIVHDRIEKSVFLLSEIDERLKGLEEQKKEALKYQKLRDEKNEYESKKSTVKFFDIKNSLERVHENILEANKTKKKQEKELSEAEQQLEQVEQKFNELAQQVKQKGEDEQLKTKEQINAYTSDINTKKNSIELMNKQTEKNIIAIQNARTNIDNLKGKIDDAKLSIDNKNDEIKSLEQNIEHEKEELEKITQQIESFSTASDENVKKRAKLRAELEDKKDEETKILQEIYPIGKDIERMEKDINDAKEIIDEFGTNKQSKLDEKEKLDLQIEELEKELKDYSMVQKTCLANLDDIKGKINDTQRNINLAVQHVTKLQAQKQAVSDFSRSPVDFIMKADIEGVRAPLAQLGRVEDEYATALEIAMGGRMASIVVEDEDVASVCMDQLISARAGRATFLPMNKIKKAPNRLNAPNVNGVVDYAFNLVDFDDEYEDAFFYALGETLIVEDRATAVKLMGKYRMVVLDGSLYDKSAAITGGHISQNRMKFSSSQDKELENAMKKLRKFQDDADKLEQRKNELESKLGIVRGDYSMAVQDLGTKRNSRDNLIESLTNAEKQLDSKQALIDELSPKLIEFKANLDNLNKKQETIKSEIDRLNIAIQEVEKAIPEDELNKLDELSDAIQTEIDRFRMAIIATEGDIKTINNEIDFHEQAIEMQKDQIEKLEKDNIDFEKNKKLTNKQIEQIQKQIDELQEKVREIDEKLHELQAQRDEAQKEVMDVHDKKRELTTNLERLEENIVALKNRRTELEPALEEIREELINAGYHIASLEPVEISTEELEKAIARIDKKMQELGDVNMMAIKEFDEVNERKTEIKGKIDTLSKEKEEITTRMQGYEDTKKTTFLEAFNKINENYMGICTQLFDGTGSLVLEEPQNPLSGGLLMKAQFRDKKEATKLTGLSGGEKTLAALAFVFAIQKYLPAPFYALDEPDASLDVFNTPKLAKMIKDQSENTQFIVVTHHQPVIESSDRTIGVTQGAKGVTKVTGIKIND